MRVLPESHIDRLKSEYGVHTIFLYGSRISEDFTQESDYDLLLIRDQGPRIRKIEVGPPYLDLIVDTNAVEQRLEDVLYLHQSRIIKDDHGFGKRLSDKVNALLADAPPAMGPERVIQRRLQILGMLNSSRGTSALSSYRRHQLLTNLLPHYFSLKRIWFLGDRYSLRWLQRNDPGMFRLFEAGLQFDASRDEIETLVHRVVD